MHIPDGYLGPQTYLASYGVMAPLWALASRKVRGTLHQREIPFMALGAAFTFVIMMFNVPIPGGTTGHAVGAVLVAILLGPWAAVVAVSVSLAVQALIFGDGGITALAANCLNMAVIMPFAGWWTYRALAGGAPPGSRRRTLAAAAGGYVGLNAAALSAAVMFGIQPALAHDAAGRALYCPFSLDVALPAMMVEHLFLFGLVEAVVTGLVVAYLGRTEPELLLPRQAAGSMEASPALWKKLLLGLVALALLTPLGLALPELAGAGEAWGEWGGERLGEVAGYLPAGLERLESLWHAPMPDYSPPGTAEASLPALSLWYVLSALLGIGVAGGLAAGVRWLLGRGRKIGRSS
jgi:cobalt/nickel transport system permease protein